MPSLNILRYNAGIDRLLLKSLHYLRKFDKIAPFADTFQDLTDEHIVTLFNSLIKRTEYEKFDPTIIESPLAGFVMPTRIIEPKAAITTNCANLFETDQCCCLWRLY